MRRLTPPLLPLLALAGATWGHGIPQAAPEWLFAQAEPSPPTRQAPSAPQNQPTQAAPFAAFAPKVGLRWDNDFLYVESNGMPSHNMMVGITNWQQQVPLPHQYFGANAWRIPLHPVIARELVSIKGRFLRGAIALAVNGIPIFNPQNNRGEVSQEIGELDQWGGHCGRADDYHYHAAPLHLQSAAGPGNPIAYALDGFPIYGLTEPDGAPLGKLDALQGHDDAKLGYHYHASTKYPYVNGGFHGQVTEAGGQVDPQPSAGGGVRGPGAPLRGAKITAFESTAGHNYRLDYELNGETRAILYRINDDGTFPFEYQNGRAGTTNETYTQRGGGGGGSPRLAPERRAPPPQATSSIPEMDALKKPNATFVLTSPEVTDGGALPVEFTGDGIGATIPLTWKGAPSGTQSYALIMDHLARGNEIKSYWTLWDIPATTTSLPRNAKGIGQIGTNFKGALGYVPPHSQGPGAKTYVLTLYALSAAPELTPSLRGVSREMLLAALQGKVLESASLHVVYTRPGAASPPPRP